MAITNLKGSVVIVTGASSGMGAATARALHAAGAYPVLAARRADRLEALAEELGGAFFLETDVTRASDVERLAAETVGRFGRVDGLVNNAGASLYGEVERVDLDEFRRILELNVVAQVAMIQAVAPAMRPLGAGTIVNISSGTTRMVPRGVSAYAASKSALNMLSQVARVELADDGIDVSLVVPFITATEFGDGVFQQPQPDGRVPHSAGFVAAVILRALQTGEERVDLLPGPEDWSLAALPA
jgi:NAD(P)-dependent dehydrogenase (short-subunit alcohol dehydrogenase family)